MLSDIGSLAASPMLQGPICVQDKAGVPTSRWCTLVFGLSFCATTWSRANKPTPEDVDTEHHIGKRNPCNAQLGITQCPCDADQT